MISHNPEHAADVCQSLVRTVADCTHRFLFEAKIFDAFQHSGVHGNQRDVVRDNVM